MEENSIEPGICPVCGVKLMDGTCPDCGWSDFQLRTERGLKVRGEIIVPLCQYEGGKCIRKEDNGGKDITHFCKFLKKFTPVSLDGVLVWCDPVFKGEVEQ